MLAEPICTAVPTTIAPAFVRSRLVMECWKWVSKQKKEGLVDLNFKKVGVSGTFNLGAAAVGLAQGKRIAQGKGKTKTKQNILLWILIVQSELQIDFNGSGIALWYQLVSV